MTCDACGCACSAGGEAPRDELKPPLLVDIETGPSPITAAPADSEVDDGMDKARLIVTSIARGLLLLLWLYLVDLMRRPFINDGDSEFSPIHIVCVGFPAVLVGMVFCQICVSISVPKDASGVPIGFEL
ncbi:uncharacterized protein [Triticum aestivum]|uniref:uncharacterized protein n=1 Tax=Triticum aestivum TaxID=4565 RepID=UPI001D031F40|nr:uncharacterized protein LOC123074329 [Triticum aestivum]